MFLFAWRLALRSLFSPALLRGVKNLPHYYSGTLLTWGKNKLIMLKVSQRWKGSVTILSKSIEPIKLLSKAKISLLPFCYRRSPLRRQMCQMIAAADYFVWVAFWCNYMASFLWKAVGHEKSKVKKLIIVWGRGDWQFCAKIFFHCSHSCQNISIRLPLSKQRQHAGFQESVHLREKIWESSFNLPHT